jgi:hypothetical protein
MPVLVSAQAGGAVSVRFPLCADDHMKSVKVYGNEAFARWDFGKSPVEGSARARVVEIVFETDGINVADQFSEAQPASDVDQGPILSGFFELQSVDIITGEGEGYLQTQWLDRGAATQWVLARIPYKEGDITVEPISPADGDARLLEWCET